MAQRGHGSVPLGGAGFNRFAAGSKSYGGGRPFPNVGRAATSGKKGYAQRDVQADARRQALLRRAGGAV